jgi:threonine dehydrogenase-like Zn-dependent dehydrogenase
VSPQEAPMFTTWRETLSFLLRRGVYAGWRVLVVGSGGNGLSFAAHAVRLGAQAVWQVGSARCEQAARGLGVSGFLDYRHDDCVALLKEACPSGFNLIVDALGKVGVADRFLPLLAVGGTLGIYGIDDYDRVSVSPRLARGSFTICGGDYDEAETHQRVSEMALQGLLSARAWYDPSRPYPLSRINEAFADLWSRKAVKALIQLCA